LTPAWWTSSRSSGPSSTNTRAEAISRPALPDAMDITDLDKVKEVASNAEQERRILEQERKRLRVEAAD
jgi:hypothetical protein